MIVSFNKMSTYDQNKMTESEMSEWLEEMLMLYVAIKRGDTRVLQTEKYKARIEFAKVCATMYFKYFDSKFGTTKSTTTTNASTNATTTYSSPSYGNGNYSSTNYNYSNTSTNYSTSYNYSSSTYNYANGSYSSNYGSYGGIEYDSFVAKEDVEGDEQVKNTDEAAKQLYKTLVDEYGWYKAEKTGVTAGTDIEIKEGSKPPTPRPVPPPSHNYSFHSNTPAQTYTHKSTTYNTSNTAHNTSHATTHAQNYAATQPSMRINHTNYGISGELYYEGYEDKFREQCAGGANSINDNHMYTGMFA